MRAHKLCLLMRCFGVAGTINDNNAIVTCTRLGDVTIGTRSTKCEGRSTYYRSLNGRQEVRAMLAG